MIKHILFVVFLAVEIYGLIDLSRVAIVQRQSKRAIAKVIFMDHGRPAVSFDDIMGRGRLAPVKSILGKSLRDGDQVEVLYFPSNPEEIQVNTFVMMWLTGIGCAIAGLLGMLLYGRHIEWARLFSKGAPGSESPADYNDAGRQTAAPEREVAAAAKGKLALSVSGGSLNDIFGLFTPLVENEDVSDIIATGPNGVYTKKSGKVVKADVKFSSQGAYEQQVERMLFLAGTSYSVAKPIVDGMVTPYVRIHAVHHVLCEDGPYVTLRVSRLSAVKYHDLISAGTAPREVFAYLRAVMMTGHTMLIGGEVGAGKTTLLRALASIIPSQESILVIEDTPEIKIEHPSVRYIRTREANIEGVGKVSPAECIRGGMRMAMNRIIFGEIRDAEAAESFIDVCVSGHPGVSTIHARSAADVLGRLELFLSRRQPGVERRAIKDQIATAVPVIVYTGFCKETGKRRITEIVEVHRNADAPAVQQPVFQYSFAGGLPVWRVLNKKSLFEESLREFEGGSPLAGCNEWLTLEKRVQQPT